MEYTIKPIGTINKCSDLSEITEFPGLFVLSNSSPPRSKSLYCSKSNKIIFNSAENYERKKDCIFDRKTTSSSPNSKFQITKYRITSTRSGYSVKSEKFVEFETHLVSNDMEIKGKIIIQSGSCYNNNINPGKIYIWDPEEMEVKLLPYFAVVKSVCYPFIIIMDTKFIVYDIEYDKEIFQVPFKDTRYTTNNNKTVYESLSINNKYIMHTYTQSESHLDLYKIMDQNDIPEEEQCVICKKRRTEKMIPSCGHMHYCEDCLNKIDKCSTCQQEFSIIKLMK